MTKTPDKVCQEYAGKNVKITACPFPEDENTILIEGDREALEFLGRLFLAQARSEDCGFQLFCAGAGKKFFTEKSTWGFYIHRLHPSPAPKTRKKRKSIALPD